MFKKLLITALSTLVIGAIGMSVYNTAANHTDEPVTPVMSVDPYSTLAAPASSVDTPPNEVQASVNSSPQYADFNNGTPANAAVVDTPQSLSSGAIHSDDSATELSQPSPDQLYDAVGNDSQGNGNGNGNGQGNTGNGNGNDQGDTGNGNGDGQGNTGNGKGGGGGGNGNGSGIGRSGNSSGSE